MVAHLRLRSARGRSPRALVVGLAVASLAAGCTPQQLLRGQVAAVPLAAPATQSYTLQPGETLWRVARRHGMTADELARQNHIGDPTKVRAGTVLTVPTATAPKPAATATSPAPAEAATAPAGAATRPAAPSPELVAALARAGGTAPRSSTAATPGTPSTPDGNRSGPAARPADAATPTEAHPATGLEAPPAGPAKPPDAARTTATVAPPDGAVTVPPPAPPRPTDSAAPPGLATPPAGSQPGSTPPRARPAQAGEDDKDPPPVTSYPFRWPVEGQVVARFGTKEGAAHDGIDIAGTSGTPVRAAAPGHVIFAGRQGSYGNLIIVRHDGGLLTVYAHLSVTLVRRGQAVVTGDALGRLGGTATAPQPLHFEVREGVAARNPLRFLPP